MVVFALPGCIGDCNQNIRGLVVDSLTKKPLDSVAIVNPEKHHIVYTDKEGRFYIHDISGGLTGCPAMALLVSKSDYKQLSETYASGDSVTIALPRSK